MLEMKKLNFRPLPGLSSSHLQTILHVYCPIETAPPTVNMIVPIDHENAISCEVSTPPRWTPQDKTIALLHGLGGSHTSNYMVRLATKFYRSNWKVVRINLRGCGSGRGLARLPYNAGVSGDIQQVLSTLKGQAPASDITLIGFSLGGSIALKLAGELGDEAGKLVHKFIAICAPLDLAHTLRMIEKKRHAAYHRYFFKSMRLQTPEWIERRPRSIYEFDDTITAPLWGYRGADEYYYKCSSIQFIPKIRHETHIVWSEDDPFIPLRMARGLNVSPHVNVWSTSHGGHMGFLGKTPQSQGIFWVDHLLHNWLHGDFATNQLHPAGDGHKK